MQFDVTYVAFEWKLFWNLTGVKYRELVTWTPGTNKKGMSSTQFMWLIKRQLKNLWSDVKLKMQVEIGGMNRKSVRPDGNFSCISVNLNEVWMPFIRIKSYDFSITCTKIDNLNVRSRARECCRHTYPPYDHSYLFHF